MALHFNRFLTNVRSSREYKCTLLNSRRYHFSGNKFQLPPLLELTPYAFGLGQWLSLQCLDGFIICSNISSHFAKNCGIEALNMACCFDTTSLETSNLKSSLTRYFGGDCVISLFSMREFELSDHSLPPTPIKCRPL